jgi:hypothetical protein
MSEDCTGESVNQYRARSREFVQTVRGMGAVGVRYHSIDFKCAESQLINTYQTTHVRHHCMQTPFLFPQSFETYGIRAQARSNKCCIVCSMLEALCVVYGSGCVCTHACELVLMTHAHPVHLRSLSKHTFTLRHSYTACLLSGDYNVTNRMFTTGFTAVCVSLMGRGVYARTQRCMHTRTAIDYKILLRC